MTGEIKSLSIVRWRAVPKRPTIVKEINITYAESVLHLLETKASFPESCSYEFWR